MLRSIRPKRAAPGWRELPLLGRPPVEQAKMPARQARAERWGESLGLVPDSPHRYLAPSVRCPLRHAKDSSRRVQGPGVELFNPPRRRSSRPTAKRLRPPPLRPQGRQGRGEAALHHGLADPSFCGKRTVDDLPGAADLGKESGWRERDFTRVGRTARPCLPRDVAAWYISQWLTSQDRARLVYPRSTLFRNGTGSASPEVRLR